MTEDEWVHCSSPFLMLDFLTNESNVSERKLRLFAVACCRHIWHLMTDERSRAAVVMAERWAESRATIKELEEARDAAWEVIGDDSLWAACSAAQHSCREDALFAANLSAEEAAWAKIAVTNGEEDNAPEREARRQPFHDSEQKIQAMMFRDIFRNPLLVLELQPEWLTANVVNLAQTIYNERLFERFPILADALLDAGCEHEEIINHCRQTGHVRGCWLLDLLLEKV